MIEEIILKRGRYGGGYLREKISREASLLGLVSNVALAILKIILYQVTGSISILADGINNIVDSASLVISIVGVAFSSKPGDRVHPYGHGRLEYLIALVVSGFVLATGIEFIRVSFDKILHPKTVEFSVVVILLMVISMGVKLWQAKFYKKVASAIDSSPLQAQSKDSLSDVLITGVIVLSIVATKFFHLKIDGMVGLLVALFIIYSAYDLIRESISVIIGRGLTEEQRREIIAKVSSYEEIYNVHDIIATDFGPEKIIVILDVEMPYDLTLEESHNIVDKVEREVSRLLNIELTIHVDPHGTGSKTVLALRNRLNRMIQQNLRIYSFHDIVIDGSDIYFDLKVNGNQIVSPEAEEELRDFIREELRVDFPKYNFNINIDREL